MTTLALSFSPPTSAQSDKGIDMPYLLINCLTILLAVFSVLMISVGAEVEQREISRVVAHMQNPSALTDGSKEIEIIRDRFLVFIILGSSFAGAFTYIGLRLMYLYGTAKPVDRFNYLSLGSGFLVSILTALFLSPGIIKLVLKTNGPEECGGFTYLFAAVATTLWDILMALGKRWILAAEKGGVSGLSAEITQGLPVPAAPPQVVPVPVAEKVKS